MTHKKKEANKEDYILVTDTLPHQKLPINSDFANIPTNASWCAVVENENGDGTQFGWGLDGGSRNNSGNGNGGGDEAILIMLA